jgi:uncharacterized membrane protein
MSENTPVQLIVAAYQDEDGAKNAVAELKKAKKEKLIAIKDAAVLRKDGKGKVHITETADMGGGKGLAFGGVVGGAVGVIAGAALAGPVAIGALIGGLAAKLRDSGFDDKRLERLGRSLTPGSSALVAVVEHKWVDDIAQELEQAGADLVTAEVARDIADQLETGHDVAYSVLATDQGLAAWQASASEKDAGAGAMVVGRDEAVGARYLATEDGFVVESIDATNQGVTADFFTGMKRAGHHAGRAASEAWGSSKTAVQGARTKRSKLYPSTTSPLSSPL